SKMNVAFMVRDIPFSPVKFAPRTQSLQFKVNDAPQPAMTLCLMDGESCGSGDYQSYMALVCATQIRVWLRAG
ncbi:hypothetical protein, partial [Salmonella enterica]|uniref:hypothetical protein n=1 Tax=Salmonella enterica TaxID=28901 RepID=UPI003299905B